MKFSSICFLLFTSLFLSISPVKSDEHLFYYFPNADEKNIQGFLRITNVDYSEALIEITGIDDDGILTEDKISFSLAPLESIQLNSQDIESGNTNKGLDGALGNGAGDWRLIINSNTELQAMNFIRTSDGFLNDMHDVVGGIPSQYNFVVPIFNPASNTNQVSKLRISNDSNKTNYVMILSSDDKGISGKRPLTLKLAPYQVAEISAQDLENGLNKYSGHGATGDGYGKWKLIVSSFEKATVVNLLQAGNYISNISGLSYDVNQRDVMFAEDFYNNSSVNGTFSGWRGSTVVTLEDGTTWKQIEAVESSQSASYSPYATYVEMQDGWFIWIEGTNQMVQVEKL